ncbi:hypothetical protein NEOLI_005183 [Neolecta irregularis DAH-3]|uniref:Uncharacterized protein n=1 Tax=Neolecta irregularis (strain DAH-3) TaxID=1198029 RepID=A0A1U7LMP7_NEOID|nr:hypothetical protein NEOLI_005183 [Neolecta irregularis DAH-3]|eukprot:OLL23917.1 hypothetical protein NEOLI_005183 [Neolecta irregularis DAH-3]
MLSSPNDESAANIEAARQWRDDCTGTEERADVRCEFQEEGSADGEEEHGGLGAVQVVPPIEGDVEGVAWAEDAVDKLCVAQVWKGIVVWICNVDLE